MSPSSAGIDPERQRRRAVGHEVDPQDLRRQSGSTTVASCRRQADRSASSTPKNIVITSPMFEESR